MQLFLLLKVTFSAAYKTENLIPHSQEPAVLINKLSTIMRSPALFFSQLAPSSPAWISDVFFSDNLPVDFRSKILSAIKSLPSLQLSWQQS